jgi:HK97 family phage portal protein
MSTLSDVIIRPLQMEDVSPGVDPNDPAVWNDYTTNSSQLSTAGVRVSQYKSFTLPAYFSCIRNISEDLAKLPLNIYQSRDGRKELRKDFKVYRLFNKRPNSEMTAFNFRQTMLQYALGWGNGVAEIVLDGRGLPDQLIPIEPWRVEIKREGGEVIYKIHPPMDEIESVGEPPVTLRSDQVLHFRGLGNGVSGYSMIQFQAEQLGVSIQAQKFASTFFSQGVLAGHVAKAKKVLGEKARNNLVNGIKKFREAKHWHKTLLLEDGVELDTINIPLRDAQFLELNEFNVEDICRWFRMPLHLVQVTDKSTENTPELAFIDYVRYTLSSWATNLEQEIEYKALPPVTNFSVSHDFKGLLKGDQKTRAEYYHKLFMIGSITPDEIRESEGYNRFDGDHGEKSYVQAQMRPLEDIAEGTPDPVAIPAPVLPSSDRSDQSDRRDSDMAAKLIELGLVIDQLCQSLQNKETIVVSNWSKNKRGKIKTVETFYRDFESDIILQLARITALFCDNGAEFLSGLARGYCLDCMAMVKSYKIPSIKLADRYTRELLEFTGGS